MAERLSGLLTWVADEFGFLGHASGGIRPSPSRRTRTEERMFR